MREETDVPTETEVLAICDGCRLVPVSYLSLDIEKPIGDWGPMLAANDIEVVTDDIGRDAITRQALGELLAERREREARLLEEAERRRIAAKPKAARPHVLARDGASPFESMVLAEHHYSTPAEEFGRPGTGGVAHELLMEELAAGQRAIAEKKRRLAEQAKDKR
jgi:hypothetical protein